MDAADFIAPNMLARPPVPSPPIDDAHKLLGIIALVVVAVLALFLLNVLGSLRRRSSHKLLHYVLLGVDTFSYTLVSYTLWRMQNSDYYFVEFPVWAVCLFMLLGGTDNLMACNLHDVDNWKSFHVKHLFQGGLVTYIILVHGQKVPAYQRPLWAIFLVNVLQSCLRIKSMRMASKSNLLFKSVKPIVEHMKHEDQLPTGEPLKPGKMEGYRYIVTGERASRSRNGTFVETEDSSFFTVEKVWRCKGSLLHSDSERGMRLKDVCLSMALSKMLNRRFAGCELHEAGLQKTHDFVFRGLLDGDRRHERAFRVIEVELGFVYDLYYTRYPYLYRKVCYFSLCLPITMVSLCSWLTYELFKIHKDLKNKNNAPLSITLLLMTVVTFMEVFQLYLHMASGWFKVALIRSYVATHGLRKIGCLSEMIISLALRLKALRPWENKLGQYSLLQNYDSTHHKSNCIHYMTLLLIDKTKKGRKRGKLVKLSTQVKQAVIDSLVISQGHLANGLISLQKNGVYEQLSWACEFSMVTETILVWHIATTICKQQLDDALAKNNKQIAALSVQDSSEVDTAALSVQDSSAVDTASSLSQYCAYLVAFMPDLLPDHSFDSSSILHKSIEDARNFAPLQGAKTMQEKCKKLLSTNDSSINDAHPVAEGARLARQLMNIRDEAKRWKVLSDFWAEMMLYIAPCEDSQARAHLEALARGGEFITHLWALLTHAGVLKRPPTGSEAV